MSDAPQYADAETGEVVYVATADEARTLTDTIRAGLTTTWREVTLAYDGCVWLALGYGNWDEYLDGEFNGAPLQLPREGRPEAMQSMRDRGMSLRAIAAVTGQSKDSVARSTVSNETVGKIQSRDGRERPTSSPAILAARARREREAAEAAAAKSAGGGNPSAGVDAPTIAPVDAASTPPPAAPSRDGGGPPASSVPDPAIEVDVPPAVLARQALSAAVVRCHALLDINPAEVGAYLLVEDRDRHLRFCDDIAAWAEMSRHSLKPNLKAVPREA